jgi:hypothetical protein
MSTPIKSTHSVETIETIVTLVRPDDYIALGGTVFQVDAVQEYSELGTVEMEIDVASTGQEIIGWLTLPSTTTIQIWRPKESYYDRST